MTATTAGRSVRAAVLLLALAAPAYASPPDGPPPSTADVLLDVPYVSQTDELCGGAALAMVLRYWGARDVFAEDFASLVDHSNGGIRTSVLAEAATDRNSQAIVLPPSVDAPLERARVETRLGRPLIALIEVQPRLYHYVVLVGVTRDDVVFHDPAKGPYEVSSRADFDRRWNDAGRWLLLVLPEPPTVPATTAPLAAPIASNAPSPPSSASLPESPCDALVAESVSLARAGRDMDADRGLLAATTICPNSASGWQELAGLRFVERRYLDAQHFAERAVALAPTDAYAWGLVATSRYLSGNLLGALDAWNHTGQPLIDRIDVDGVERTHYPVIVKRSGLVPRQLITSEAVARAAQRLEDWPIASTAAVRYDPIDSGDTASVHLVVAERSVLPEGAIGWGAIGLHSLIDRETGLSVVSPAGEGDVWSASYRWASNRPRVGFALTVPAPRLLPGVVAIDASWERQSYAPTIAGAGNIVEDQRHAGASLSDWATGWLRWQAGLALDHFDAGDYASLDAALNVRGFRDRVGLTIGLSRYAAVSAGPGFSTGDISIAWRSTPARNVSAWTARAGLASASAAAPLALWPVVSSSDARGELLRAHALFDDGVITSNLLGHDIASATVEYSRPVWTRPLGSIAVAGFIDTAESWRRREPGPSPLEADIGAGLRVAAPGAGGTVRIDWAYGLRDGAWMLSAGYLVPWGERRGGQRAEDRGQR